MKMRLRTSDEADVNITSLIDCLMQCIIFFMVIMSAEYVFGVAVKFPVIGTKQTSNQQKGPEEKKIVVYVQQDIARPGHIVVQEGVLKLNGEVIGLAVSPDTTKWEAERKRGLDYLRWKMGELVKEGYKKDVIYIQGDIRTYHGKIMSVIDQAKAVGIDGISLAPPASVF
jgi:biopolymer transport protein ExbD